MVVEVCVCELEEAAAGGGRVPPQPITVDSPHPYADDTDISGNDTFTHTREVNNERYENKASRVLKVFL